MNWNELFDYDPDTGKLYWKISPSDKVKAGQEAGSNDVHGYTQVKALGVVRKAHRVIWDLCNPDDLLKPGEQIDHIDHDRRNNRITNLRKVSSAGNHKNMSLASNNTSGVTGVSWCKTRKLWRAYIRVESSFIGLGYFENKDDAVVARKNAEKELGFHKNHGAIK